MATATSAPVEQLTQDFKSTKLDTVSRTTTGGPTIIGNIDYADLKTKPIDKSNYEYAPFLPSFPNVKWEALEPVEYNDVAIELNNSPSSAGPFSDKDYQHLFAKARTVTHLTHKVGTEIRGLDLNTLTDVEKKELALLLARRVVVFVRGQKNWSIENQIKLGEFWGPLHRHATTSLPKAYVDPSTVPDEEEAKGSESDSDGTLGSDSENEGVSGKKKQYKLSNYLLKNLDKLHTIYADHTRISPAYSSFTAQRLWHSDVTYERQTPSYTSLKLLKTPTAGGDTLWVSTYDIYDQLSPSLQHYLETHWAIHSAHEQAEDARVAGTTVRREPIKTIHPLVRVHPVTGWKAVFVNPGFTRAIVGVPKGESDTILNYLFNLVANSPAATVRFKWESEQEGLNEYGETVGNDVAFWDNRAAVHSATYSFYPETRHGLRVTVAGELSQGVYDKEDVESEGEIGVAAAKNGGRGTSQQAAIDQVLGVKRGQDGTKRGNYND